MIHRDPNCGSEMKVERWCFALSFLVAILRLSAPGIWIAGGAACALTVVFLRWGRLGVWRAIGAASLLLPIGGDGVLLAVGLWGLALMGVERGLTRWASPFLVVLVANLIAGLAIDLAEFGGLWRGAAGGILSFESWRSSSSYLFPALGGVLRTVLLIGLFGGLASDLIARRAVRLGVVWGAVIAGAIIAVSLTLPQFDLLPQRGDLWIHLRRHAGTFTDPNAFGVAAVLVVAVVLHVRRNVASGRVGVGLVCLAVTWCGLALASGSRVFFIGVGVLAFLALFALSRRTALGVVALGIVAIAGLQVMPVSVDGLPIGLERLFNSLRFDHLGETVYSRAVFWRIAGAVIGDHPWLGVGLGVFSREVEPYAQMLGIPLGTWTDNANSYYLGILAELGVVGALGWGLAVSALRWRNDSLGHEWSRWGIGALLVMSVVGPHLDFDEVTVLCGVMLAEAVVVRSGSGERGRTFRAPAWIVGWLVASAIVAVRLGGEWGLQSYERDDLGRFRWSGPRAMLREPCANGVATLTLRAVHPRLDSFPVIVRVATALEEREVTLSSSAPSDIPLRCSGEGAGESAIPGAIGVTVDVSPPLVPASAFGGDDTRILGVQIRALEK